MRPLFLIIVIATLITASSGLHGPTPNKGNGGNQPRVLADFNARGNKVKVIRGVNYNPVAISTNRLDPTAPNSDIPRIIQLGANTIGTYNTSLFEWENLSDVNTNKPFYSSLANLADVYKLNIILGYFANNTVNWTDTARRAKMTSQYKQLVNTTKNRPSTYMYLLGNELFEKLADNSNREAYARWVGEMVEWTHSQNPSLKVTYADNHVLTALPWIKRYSPNLDVYSVNSYEWDSIASLQTLVDKLQAQWPGKPMLLHEWGTDSYNSQNRSENLTAQADKIAKLANIVETVVKTRPQLLGSLYFEYADQWDKAKSSNTQDPASASWRCSTCFDGVANEDYWGLTTNTQVGMANKRLLKPAYFSLKKVWSK